MAGKTNSDIIRECVETIATLTERLDNARGEIKKLDAERADLAKVIGEIRTSLATLEVRLETLQKGKEEGGRRTWLIVVAVIGSLLAFGGNLVLTFLKKGP